MANVIFDDLFPEVAPFIPSAPRPSMRRALRLAAIELCTKSDVYRYDFSENSVADQSLYTLTLPAETRLHKVISAYYDKKPLDPTSERLLRDNDPEWRDNSGVPTEFFQTAGDSLNIARPPVAAVTGGITGQVALAPSRAATGFDQYLLEEYYLTLVAGALSSLYQMPGRDWTSPPDAGTQLVLFREGIQIAKTAANQDHQPKRRTVKYGGL